MKKLYLHSYFFIWLLSLMGLFLLSFFWERLFPIAQGVLYVFIFLCFIDFILIFSIKNGITANRILPERLSNSDENLIEINVKSKYPIAIYVYLIDEIPFQFQKRNFGHTIFLKKYNERIFQYYLRPTERGEYNFGKLNAFVFSPLRLLMKRYISCENAKVATYPSFIQMKKFELIAFSQRLFDFGLKKIRKIGHTMEFEHIRDYVQGDDIRTINWKASSKRGQLMVNQYQDEKSQNVYTLIDKGRSMQMPFEELSLLDYAINTSLALTNIILKKQDKAGIFTFSQKIEDRVVAERKSSQMEKIMNTLYAIETNFLETDFGRLYTDINSMLKQRSLLLLYTNFETRNSLHRQLPYLKAIAKKHLLVVIFFKNTELEEMIHKPSSSIREVYDKVIAEKFSFEKRLIVQELTRNGIQCILTAPKDLTLQSINKYLELKARGMI